jgi:adenine-specific DNA-methyltransferase
MDDKVDVKSVNITKDKLDQLKELFPEVVTENKIDFEKLKLTLGDEVEVGKERYGMNWPGKANCFKVIQEPSIGTLKPIKENSMDFDRTENLFIEGDSLEVLKLLQKSYYGKIKMIYIDPPYNTGKDFIYPDNYTESLDTYLRYTGQKGEGGIKLTTNAETEGRYHSKWMNMMFPRLFLARNLLTEVGVIFISIDDHEVDNLKKICNEIFGEENFIANIARRRRDSQANLAHNISPIHEYILCYGKSTASVLNKITPEINENDYKNPDNDPRGPYVTMPCSNRRGARYEIITPTGVKHNDEWRFKEETFINLREDNRIIFPNNGNGKPRYKLFLSEKKDAGVIPNTWWDNLPSNQEGSSELLSLFDGKKVFDNPKPVGLLKHIIQLGSDEDSFILDFFAGSASTAHAVLELNKEDEGNRKFIMVQLQEPTEEDPESDRAEYKNIAEISEERIRRVINRMREEGVERIDLGFKIFRLDESNFKIWDKKSNAPLQEQLQLSVDNINPHSDELDILYEIILKSGFPVTVPVEKLEIQGKALYSVDDRSLLICLDNNLTQELMNQLSEMEAARVVCLDRGFNGNDQLKTNTVERMKVQGVDFKTV